MTLNYGQYDVEKYQLKWLRVLWLYERIWVRVLCVSIVCYLLIIVLILWFDHVSYNIMLELHQLA